MIKNILKHSPFSEFEQHSVPNTNIVLPRIKIKNMTTAYPSKPQIRNIVGTGSGGGGLGQDRVQSTHEHAGFIPC
ncbi:CLUMA_CG014615, isoform A [Clunio marinus]|uniref:CLUMA_CG014615, isoform A n=1 Tax=Clunio marinus TaxID=568069 RepID=A0A1J1IN06_9DIPT|nr:CLUMA_CG014615, isoform A [Clunio marinus]